MEANRIVTRHLKSFIISLNFGIKGTVDYILAPTIITCFGYSISLSITIILYFIIGIVTIKLYDFYKIDLVEIEKFKENNHEHIETKYDNKIIQIIQKINNMKVWNLNKYILLAVLSLSINPGLVVIYFRNGFKQYDGFKENHIKHYFFLSIIISNILWNTFVLFLKLFISEILLFFHYKI